jgi:hypothetical protein
MCQDCIDQLQQTMDEAMTKTPSERLLVHLDASDDAFTAHGTLLSQVEVEAGLHDSMNEKCWCNPIIIEPSETRTAEEIYTDYLTSSVEESLQ